MNYVAWLTKGSSTLDLSSGRYGLMADFVPPTTQIQPLISSTSMSGMYGATRLAGRKTAPFQFTFTVKLTVGSNAELERAFNDLDYFLQQAGDENNPEYIEWLPHTNVSVSPIYGQFNARRRMKVLWGECQKGPSYAMGDVRSHAANDVKVNLVVEPLVLGARQQWARAKGGVRMDTWGVKNGLPRGVNVAAPMVNGILNPVFGGSPFNNGWTADAGLGVVQNTDPDFLLPETKSSARLINGSGSNYKFYTSVTAISASWRAVYLIKLSDGSAPTNSDVQILFNGSPVTTNFTLIGNGLYAAWGGNSGFAGATTTGLRIYPGRTVYLLAGTFYSEPLNMLTWTAIGWGDLPGWSWSSTPHNSTSVRADGALSIPMTQATVRSGSGTLCVLWKDSMNSPDNDLILFDASYATIAGGMVTNNLFRGTILASGGGVRFEYGATTLTSGAFSPSNGSFYVFHFTWGVSGMAIYVNGASIASTASFTPISLGGSGSNRLYIGSSNVPANWCDGVISGPCIYDRPLGGTEILADYNNIKAVFNSDQTPESVPYLMTIGNPETTLNPDFESGGAPHWANWSENIGDGNIEDSTIIVHNGGHAAKLTAGATRNTYIYQTYTVTPGETRHLSFWNRGNSAVVSGRYSVYDVTHSADIISPVATGVFVYWYRIGIDFVVPAGCTSIQVRLWCVDSNAEFTFFDDVSLKLVETDTIQQCTDGTRQSYGVAAGVVGSVEALTEYDIAPSVITKAGYWLARTAVEAYRAPVGEFYFEEGGTADANASNGSANPYTTAETNTQLVNFPTELCGDAHVFIRMNAPDPQGAAVAPGYSYRSGYLDIVQATRILAQAASYKMYYLSNLYVAIPTQIAQAARQIYVGYTAISGGATTGYVDFYMILNGPLMRMYPQATSGWASLLLKNKTAIAVDAGKAPAVLVNTKGQEVNLSPGKYNYLWFIMADDNEAHVITDTATFNAGYITPRWVVL